MRVGAVEVVAQLAPLGGVDGLPLLPPGVVPVTEWRTNPGLQTSPAADLHAGVARIPRRGRR